MQRMLQKLLLPLRLKQLQKEHLLTLLRLPWLIRLLLLRLQPLLQKLPLEKHLLTLLLPLRLRLQKMKRPL
jgi:hypothetical protein